MHSHNLSGLTYAEQVRNTFHKICDQKLKAFSAYSKGFSKIMYFNEYFS